MKPLAELYREAIDKLRTAWDDDPSNNHHFIDGEAFQPIDDCVAEVIEAAEQYRNFEWCECGCEGCHECANGCIVRTGLEESLGKLRAVLEERGGE